jgi:hypothetical protein
MEEKRAILLKGLLFTTLLWGGIALLLVAFGSDFEAERRCGWLSNRCKLTMCGFIRGVLPASFDAAPCWLLYALPFALIPGFVLWRVIQNEARLWLGERGRAR